MTRYPDELQRREEVKVPRSVAIIICIVALVIMGLVAIVVEARREEDTNIRNFNQRCADGGGTLIVMPDERDNRCEIPYGH